MKSAKNTASVGAFSSAGRNTGPALRQSQRNGATHGWLQCLHPSAEAAVLALLPSQCPAKA